MIRVEGHEKTYIQSSRTWECGNPEGISKEGGKPASWLSMLSILCHFHGLLFAGITLDTAAQLAQCAAPPAKTVDNETL